MVLRSEKHRQILLQTIKQMSYVGELAEDIVELKAELMTATIEAEATKPLADPPTGNGSSAHRPDDALQHRA
jgi:type II secretory pathway component PulM